VLSRAARRWGAWIRLSDLRNFNVSDAALISFTFVCLGLSALLWIWFIGKYFAQAEQWVEREVHTCPELHSLSPPTFYDTHILGSQPFVLRKGVAHWAAIKNWGSDDYLRRRAGGAENRSDGFGYASSSWWTEFGAFLDVAFGGKDPKSIPNPRISHELIPNIRGGGGWPKGDLRFYFNLQNLTDPEESFVHTHFQEDFEWPLFAQWLFHDQVNMWIGGPEEITSQLHYDGGVNLLAQVSGVKRVALLPPSDRPFLYLNKSGITPNFSPVHLDHPDLKKYPKFAQARTPIVCEIFAGDLLHIPATWFHQVTSRGRNVAVNFWFLYPTRARVAWMRFLHRFGFAVG